MAILDDDVDVEDDAIINDAVLSYTIQWLNMLRNSRWSMREATDVGVMFANSEIVNRIEISCLILFFVFHIVPMVLQHHQGGDCRMLCGYMFRLCSTSRRVWAQHVLRFSECVWCSCSCACACVCVFMFVRVFTCCANMFSNRCCRVAEFRTSITDSVFSRRGRNKSKLRPLLVAAAPTVDDAAVTSATANDDNADAAGRPTSTLRLRWNDPVPITKSVRIGSPFIAAGIRCDADADDDIGDACCIISSCWCWALLLRWKMPLERCGCAACDPPASVDCPLVRSPPRMAECRLVSGKKSEFSRRNPRTKLDSLAVADGGAAPATTAAEEADVVSGNGRNVSATLPLLSWRRCPPAWAAELAAEMLALWLLARNWSRNDWLAFELLAIISLLMLSSSRSFCVKAEVSGRPPDVDCASWRAAWPPPERECIMAGSTELRLAALAGKKRSKSQSRSRTASSLSSDVVLPAPPLPPVRVAPPIDAHDELLDDEIDVDRTDDEDDDVDVADVVGFAFASDFC